jgi:hypothetical protein
MIVVARRGLRQGRMPTAKTQGLCEFCEHRSPPLPRFAAVGEREGKRSTRPDSLPSRGRRCRDRSRRLAVSHACQARRIRDTIEADGDRLSDLHLRRLGPDHLGAIVSVSTPKHRGPDYYRRLLDRFRSLSHVTVEIDSR